MEKKVLLVDDEPMITDMLSAALSDRGYTVYTANNGKQGLKTAKERLPHIIVLDVMMPQMDGFEMLRRLKKEKDTVKIPVIMLTGKKEQADIQSGMELQADKYLVKPVNTEQVVTEIEKTLALQASRF